MSQVTKQKMPPEAVEPVRVLGRGLRAQRGVRLTLRTLREAVGKTQADIALEAQIDQADISRLESRKEFDDCLVSTLRRYLEALGGEFELVAAFGNKRIALAGAAAAIGSPSVLSANTSRFGKAEPHAKRRQKRSRSTASAVPRRG